MRRKASKPFAVLRLTLLASLLTVLSSCTSFDRNQRADDLAHNAGLQREQIEAGIFTLTAYTRIVDATQPLTIYIEGDGFAWVTRDQPSSDPTPRKATGLTLAVADAQAHPSANIAYLARPCQYTLMNLNPKCNVAYWTGKRFAPEVIASINAGIDKITSQMPALQKPFLNLIGYSGGGAVAVLIAAQRKDVATLRTVAGNLDHVYVNQIHNVSPMPASLNAIDVAAQIAGIPQIHFSGADDDVVPPAVAQRFIQAEGNTACTQHIIVPDMTHDGDWSRHWATLLDTMPACRN